MGFDLFSAGQNNIFSPSAALNFNDLGSRLTGMDLGAGGNIKDAMAAPGNAANAAIRSGNLATANEQAIYSDTYDKLNPYVQNGFDSMNMMRQMMGMAPLSPTTSGAPNAATPTPGVGNPFRNPQTPNTTPPPQHRLHGGGTYPGQSYVVGEHGPEIVHMAPGSHGYVEPNSPKANKAAYGHSYPGSPIHRMFGGDMGGVIGRGNFDSFMRPGTGAYSGGGSATTVAPGSTPMAGSPISRGIGGATSAEDVGGNGLRRQLGPFNTGANTTPGTAGGAQTAATTGGSSPASGSTGMTPDQIMSLDPGYQFQLQQGLQAVQNSNLAMGTGLSGREEKGEMGYAEGLAKQSYGDIFNREATLAGMGESAAGTLGEIGMYTGMNEGNNYLYSGNAAAGGLYAPFNLMNGVMGNISSFMGGGGGSMLMGLL